MAEILDALGSTWGLNPFILCSTPSSELIPTLAQALEERGQLLCSLQQPQLEPGSQGGSGLG